MDLMKCLTSLRVNRQFFSRYQARYYCFSLGQIPINSVYAMATVYPVNVVIICKNTTGLSDDTAVPVGTMSCFILKLTHWPQKRAETAYAQCSKTIKTAH